MRASEGVGQGAPSAAERVIGRAVPRRGRADNFGPWLLRAAMGPLCLTGNHNKGVLHRPSRLVTAGGGCGCRRALVAAKWAPGQRPPLWEASG
eukprot:396234-Pyramimonas_sp.AAC.2